MRWTIVSNDLLYDILEVLDAMTAQLDQLSADVEQNTSVTDSAVTLLENLAAEIRANANDPAALTDLASKLEANSQKLADAVAANT
jgi:hypothetical protein